MIRNLVVRRGHYSGEMMLVFVTTRPKSSVLSKSLRKLWQSFQRLSQSFKILTIKYQCDFGKEFKTLYGKDTIVDSMLGNQYEISARSFYQVNTEMAEKLYQTAIDFSDLTPKDIVIDAYSGIGTIGLSFAKMLKPFTASK